MKRRLYYADKEKYWKRLDSVRNKTGYYPQWVFDFISIHIHPTKDGSEAFTIISPMCLMGNGKRPRMEKKVFYSFDSAKRFSIDAAQRTGTFVVSCVKP